VFTSEDPMTKKLTRHGNSYAVVLDRGVLDLLKIDQDTPLDISTDGNVIILAPIRDAKRRRQFEASLERVNRKFGPVLKRLAD
jgi:antitoxin component of MazEF toxin-antitoxin module